MKIQEINRLFLKFIKSLPSYDTEEPVTARMASVVGRDIGIPNNALQDIVSQLEYYDIIINGRIILGARSDFRYRTLDFIHYKDEILKVFPSIQSADIRIGGKEDSRIDLIELYKHPNGRYLTIFFNKDWRSPINLHYGKNAQLLYKIAGGEKIATNKAALAFFNSHSKNKIYTRSSYKPQQIIGEEGGMMLMKVKAILLTDRQYKIRLNT